MIKWPYCPNQRSSPKACVTHRTFSVPEWLHGGDLLRDGHSEVVLVVFLSFPRFAHDGGVRFVVLPARTEGRQHQGGGQERAPATEHAETRQSPRIGPPHEARRGGVAQALGPRSPTGREASRPTGRRTRRPGRPASRRDVWTPDRRRGESRSCSRRSRSRSGLRASPRGSRRRSGEGGSGRRTDAGCSIFDDREAARGKGRSPVGNRAAGMAVSLCVRLILCENIL
ncbi:hypothetical protein HPB50_000589 [Hyalomma asiaticum]|uniref:Uncharacterized protein n=1 Tax=Hyalomma asiaticum TaxID=266040 RepID=A0ACB7RIN6_HYAAI|nr:hypothetical protein HPB50_000589 [Hyalomma asiaticum]